MRRMLSMVAALALSAAVAACAGMNDKNTSDQGMKDESMHAAMMAPPGGNHRKVSELVPLPDFIPGLGTLYVQPNTLPAGPFLAYDKTGKLVSTIYMIPIADIQAQKKFDELAVGDWLWLAGPALPEVGSAKGGVVEIRTQSDDLGARVGFEPIGLLIPPGRTVRWINAGNNVHTTTAYHPDNDDHPLRIPETARPWDSDYLINPGDRFEATLTIEGVYDYFCKPHEMAGMVGRFIVGRPAGPGTLPFDYFEGDPARQHWQSVPEGARRAFPAIDLIMAKGVVARS